MHTSSRTGIASTLMVASAVIVSVNAASGANYALRVNGNQYGSVLHDVSLEFASPPVGTIELWVSRDAIPLGSLHLLGKRSGCGAGVNFYQFVTFPPGDSSIAAGWVAGCTSDSPPLPAAQWFHIALAADGDSVRYYVNGAQVRVYDCIEHQQNTGPLRLGTSGSCNSGWIGELDEVRIWNVARTGDEISSYLPVSSRSAEHGLVGYWTFDEEVADQNIYDLSPLANDGTLGETLNVEPSDPTRILATHPFDCAAGITEMPLPEPAAGRLRFLAAVPNPFLSEVTIVLRLPASGRADLRIYDSQGRLVRMLASDYQHPGRHEVIWDGKDDSGRPAASGVYFERIVMGGRAAVGAILRLR